MNVSVYSLKTDTEYLTVVVAFVSMAAIAHILNRFFKQDRNKVENTDDHFKISCTSPISVHNKKFEFNSSEMLEHLDSYEQPSADMHAEVTVTSLPSFDIEK